MSAPISLATKERRGQRRGPVVDNDDAPSRLADRLEHHDPTGKIRLGSPDPFLDLLLRRLKLERELTEQHSVVPVRRSRNLHLDHVPDPLPDDDSEPPDRELVLRLNRLGLQRGDPLAVGT